MTIVTTMCKLLFAMLIGFYLFKKDILTKEVNAKLSSLIVQITCPCIILNSLSTVSHEDTGMILKLFLGGVVMYVIFPILSWIITKTCMYRRICVGLTCACLFFQIVHLWVIRWYRRYMVTARFSILRSSTCHSVSCFSPWVCIC